MGKSHKGKSQETSWGAELLLLLLHKTKSQFCYEGPSKASYCSGEYSSENLGDSHSEKTFCFVSYWPTFLRNIVESCYIYPSSCHTPEWLDKPGLLSPPEMKKMLDCAAWSYLHKEGETQSAEGKQSSRLSIRLLSKICNSIAQKCHWLEGSHLLLRAFKVC